jgi:pimeloyl-ACP methyl ester carboxylesterase
MPVLVFLHEGLGSVALWKDFPELVAEATGCSALVYSRYGYGKSDRLTQPRAVDYMHQEALEALPEVLDALSIRDPVLIGHSDGASISIIHAASGRQPVRGLVLMAPHVFVEDITIAAIAQAKAAFEAGDLATKLGRYHEDPMGAFRGWSEIWLHPDFRAWNIEACLPRITAPALLIQGEDDQYGTMAQIEALERQLGGPVETAVLARCAHSPHVDQTQGTLEAIAEFVESARR